MGGAKGWAMRRVGGAERQVEQRGQVKQRGGWSKGVGGAEGRFPSDPPVVWVEVQTSRLLLLRFIHRLNQESGFFA